MTTEKNNQRRKQLEQLSDLDLTLMAGDYLTSLEEHAAAKDWQSAESLRPDLGLLDEIMKGRGLYDALTEPRLKEAEALLDEGRASQSRANRNT